MIQFAQPWALLALLSIPAIIVLYSLRPKRETILVSTNKLWREAFRERQRGFGLQKLLRDLSLLLLLLFALLLSLALAGPGWITSSTGRDAIVLVFDVSASMKARRDNSLLASSRFAEAKRQGLEIIDGLDEDASLLLMTSGRNATIRSAFEADRATLRSALGQIDATDETGKPRQALTLALSLLRNREKGRVVFFTDAAFDDDVDLDTSRIEFRRIDGPVDNVAITRFDFRAETGSEERHQVLVGVRNYTDKAVSTQLELELNEQRLLSHTLELEPQEHRNLVLPIDGRITGTATAVIQHEDALAEDNQAFAVVEGEQPLHLLLISPGNFYLESVFGALPNVSVTRLETIPGNFARLADRHDVVVIDRIAVPDLPPGSYLLIDTLAPGLPFVAEGAVTRPEIETRSDSAILRDIDLEGLEIQQAKRLRHVRESPGLQTLFGSGNTDLALALIENNVRLVFLGFDIADSNFPLQASFPLFLGESLTWLHAGAIQHARTQVAAGDPVTISTPNRQSELIVESPSGKSSTFSVQSGEQQFEATGQAGLYRYVTDSIDGYFAVNLTSQNESDIRPRAILPARAQPASTTAQAGRVNIALWPQLVLLAMLLLALEWSLWCWRGVSA